MGVGVPGNGENVILEGLCYETVLELPAKEMPY